jgi:hypothetical protein
LELATPFFCPQLFTAGTRSSTMGVLFKIEENSATGTISTRISTDSNRKDLSVRIKRTASVRIPVFSTALFTMNRRARVAITGLAKPLRASWGLMICRRKSAPRAPRNANTGRIRSDISTPSKAPMVTMVTMLGKSGIYRSHR